MLSPESVLEAQKRISPYLSRTPLIESSLLNSWLGHDLIFKVESFQRTGAFKARGALNALLLAKATGKVVSKVVTVSSGNHGQAIAWAGRLLQLPVTVFTPADISAVKRQAMEGYGAKVIATPTRAEADAAVENMKESGAHFVHPYDNDDVIAGQGTACLEALQDNAHPTAIFGPCGGGGLLSGTILATETQVQRVRVFGAEPALGNDAVRSYRSKTIVRLPESPPTIADGARTLAISARTLQHLLRLQDFFEVSEDDICYWAQWLPTLLKVTVEPTSAVAMGGALQWLKSQRARQRVLVILSGGNVDRLTYQKIWKDDLLREIPSSRMRHSGGSRVR
jgi:threonine dehydratase